MSSELRIGLYGPMANAGYTLTRGLRAAGYDAEYIHDPEDRYPMSQPLWEDVELTIDPEGLPYDVPTAEEWDHIARAHGWVRPPWVVEMKDAPAADLSRRQRMRAARLLAAAPRHRPEIREHLVTHAPRIAAFASYDWLIVSGVRVIDAFLSGKPYVLWPNGGDVSIVPFRRDTRYQRFESAAMRRAIRAAAVCGTHDPMLAAFFEKLGVRDVPFLPFLVDTERYAPRPHASISEVALDVERRAEGRPIVLIAARQDVRWKGTDRFARAYKRAVSAGGEFLLAVSPWGDDTGLVQDALKHGPGDGVYVLPGVMSKPLLIDLYTVADVVVDQFVLGVHGSTMLEALACATPVMISLDVDRFRERWASWEEPPILNVATEDEIFAALMSIAAGEQGLAAMGRDGRAWVERVHGVENAHRFLPDDGGRQAPARIKNVRGEPETGGSAIPASGGSTRARP